MKKLFISLMLLSSVTCFGAAAAAARRRAQAAQPANALDQLVKSALDTLAKAPKSDFAKKLTDLDTMVTQLTTTLQTTDLSSIADEKARENTKTALLKLCEAFYAETESLMQHFDKSNILTYWFKPSNANTRHVQLIKNQIDQCMELINGKSIFSFMKNPAKKCLSPFINHPYATAGVLYGLYMTGTLTYLIPKVMRNTHKLSTLGHLLITPLPAHFEAKKTK